MDVHILNTGIKKRKNGRCYNCIQFNNENVANSITYIGILWKMRKIPCEKGTKVRIEQNRTIIEFVKGEGTKYEV